MNFYKHNLGDYDGATAHISWDEDMAYTRLMRAYYRREAPIPDADKYRLIRATTKAQRAALDRVLSEFFERDGDVWRQKRCDEEIAAYKAQAEVNKRIATDRTNRQRTVNESSTKGSPVYMGEREPKQKQNHKTEPEPEVLSKASAYAESPTRAAENRLRACLEKHKVNTDGMWPSVWAERGITDEQLARCIAIARDRLKGEELRSTYLDKVLSDSKNLNHVNGSHSKSWILSASGIEAKGRELGIESTAGEDFQTLRARVYQAAGITADDVRRAEAAK